jgi:hypothetical protein
MWIKLFNDAVSTAEDLNRSRWKYDQQTDFRIWKEGAVAFV